MAAGIRWIYGSIIWNSTEEFVIWDFGLKRKYTACPRFGGLGLERVLRFRNTLLGSFYMMTYGGYPLNSPQDYLTAFDGLAK